MQIVVTASVRGPISVPLGTYIRDNTHDEKLSQQRGLRSAGVLRIGFQAGATKRLPEDSGIPFECGYGAAPQDTQPNDARELAVPRDGWRQG